MKNKFTANMHLSSIVLLLIFGVQSYSNAIGLPPIYSPITMEVNLSSEWQEYSITNGVLIEYKLETVNSSEYGREVSVVLLRFTNTTNERKECSWTVKIERDGECYNCSSLMNQDGGSSLYLNPKQVAEGDASNLISRPELNIFGNFVKLVPGMTDQKLTGFELINLTIK